MVLDFFLPQEKIAVEVQGQQHYELNTFYHKNRLDFINQLSRDKQKREFCERNNIRLIELPYNESDEEWSIRLNE
jgi:very-short-patch-repair endonuclease